MYLRDATTGDITCQSHQVCEHHLLVDLEECNKGEKNMKNERKMVLISKHIKGFSYWTDFRPKMTMLCRALNMGHLYTIRLSGTIVSMLTICASGLEFNYPVYGNFLKFYETC